MKAHNVRNHLRQALEEIEHASQATAGSDVERQLAGITEVLIVSEEPSTTPEAVIYPERGVLDTIQQRLTTIIAETDDEAVVDHLERARRELLIVIMTLDDQWKRQHEL